jgi:histidyl-tRNA synthetase
VQVNMGGGSFKAQLKRADRSGASMAVIIGDDEAARGVAAIKPLRSEAGQQECAIGELPARVAGLLRGN